LWSLALWPRFPATHDLVHDAWLHAVYFTLFLYGWWIGTDTGWWGEATRLRWVTLGLASAAVALHFGLRALVVPTDAVALRVLPRLAADLYLWCALLAILGWAHLKLNRPWRWLDWANESVYPWYVLHQTVIIVAVFWLAPLGRGPVVEPALLVVATLAVCWGITAVVRRTSWLRPLFGLKLKRRELARRPSPATPACLGANSA